MGNIRCRIKKKVNSNSTHKLKDPSHESSETFTGTVHNVCENQMWRKTALNRYKTDYQKVTSYQQAQSSESLRLKSFELKSGNTF